MYTIEVLLDTKEEVLAFVQSVRLKNAVIKKQVHSGAPTRHLDLLDNKRVTTCNGMLELSSIPIYLQ